MWQTSIQSDTAILAGNTDANGVGLLEIYDLSRPRTRTGQYQHSREVGTGGDMMIAGFILEGGGGADAIIVRGLGPSLAGSGIPNVVADPQMELRNSDGALVRSNNNWADDPAQASLISAAGLAPGNALEAAIVENLSWTIHGVALWHGNGPHRAWSKFMTM